MEADMGWVPVSAPPEIAFFDVETTVPGRVGGGVGYALLEFGAILVCPRRLVEVGSFSTLIRPGDPAAISPVSVRCNGITRDAVAAAPSFAEVADTIFAILHGRVWAGHNIVRFDCARIREAFAEIGRPAPEAKGLIDTLPLLTQRFGRRAGDMKMASLASYFGLGRQTHRSLDDVRMNLEVLKYCATVLFLEASLPEVLSVNFQANRIIPLDETNKPGVASPSDPSTPEQQFSCMPKIAVLDAHVQTQSAVPRPNIGPSELAAQIEEIKLDPSEPDNSMLRQSASSPNGFPGFLEPDELSLNRVRASVVSSNQFGRRILIHHKDCLLQLCCMGLSLHFGVSAKFLDNAGRPKLSIVVGIPENLCEVLDFCDNLAQRTFQESGSTSQWRPVVRKNGYLKPPSIRLHIPTVTKGDSAIYSTEICRKEPAGDTQKLEFGSLEIAELDSVFVLGNAVDAFFCLDFYDYQEFAGIRLVAKRLVVQSKQH